MFEESPAVQLIIDPADGRVAYASAAACRFYGYAPEAIAGLDAGTLGQLSAEDLATARAAVDAGRREFASLHAAAHGGGRLQVEADGVDVGGRRLLLVTLKDDGAAEAARDDATESGETYRALFARNPHPMWVFDAESLRFLEVNEAATERYGYSRDEFLAMPVTDIRPPAEVPRLLERLKEYRAARPTGGPAAIQGQWRHRRKDGTLIDVEVRTHEVTFRGRNAFLVVALSTAKAKLKLRSSPKKLPPSTKVSGSSPTYWPSNTS